MSDDDDPFSEPQDTDKTVIRPNPGGRRASIADPSAPSPPAPEPAPPAEAAPAREQAPASVEALDPAIAATLEAGQTGLNPLNAAAATLFSLVSRIRNRAQHRDPEALRASVVSEIRDFEARAMKAGVDPQQIKVARYAISATIDDVVLNTPWGGASIWAQQSMVATFHRETVGGDRFYDLLARLEQDPGPNIDLLEFLYVCLSLGFEGRLRVEQGSADRHMSIRSGLAKIIRAQRGATERDLSLRWMGVNKPHKPLSAWKPVWIAVGAMALILGTGFLGLSYALSGTTNKLLGEFAALDSGRVAVIEGRGPPISAPPPPTDTEIKRVTRFLEAEIAEKLVTVFQDRNTITVRIAGRGMFGSGSDKLQPAFNTPLSRVAAALNDTTGPVIIVGHSDNVPIRTARFPSNMHLSLARAEAVMRSIGAQLNDPRRLRAEGRADKQPIAPNATPEGRATNRRIEIVLIKENAT